MANYAQLNALPTSPAPMPDEAPHILVVDDEQLVRDALVSALQKAGYRVTAAKHGRIALDLITQELFALVVMDLIMPEQEGMETIARLRRLAPKTPVIAISGGADEYLRMATMMGAKLALSKPFTAEAFVEAVERVLRDPGK